MSRLEDNLQQVTGLVGHLSGVLSEISAATLSQGDSIHKMTRRLHSLNNVARRTGELVSTATEASEKLHNDSHQLMQAVARFRLPA